MGYYKEQVKKEKKKVSPKEIAVISPDLIFKIPMVLFMEHHSITKPHFVFRGVDDKIYFIGNNSFSKTVICNSEDVPLINVRGSPDKFKIYLGDDKKKLIANTIPKNSFHANKMTLSYYNIVSESDEILDYNIDSAYRSAGLFIGKERDNSPMIFKIQRLKKGEHAKSEYALEMSAGVDNIFLVSLGVIFMFK